MIKINKVIYGLGNPDEENRLNRHNVGWILVDIYLSSKNKVIWKKDTNAEIGWTEKCISGKTILFPRSERYMNDQGVTLKKFIKNNNIDSKNNLLIIYDDLDLPFGKFKLQKNNLSPTHKGIISDCKSLRTKDVWSIKVGIDNRDKKNRTNGYNYVLDNFTEGELQIIYEIAKEINKVINYWVEGNFDLAFKLIKGNVQN